MSLEVTVEGTPLAEAGLDGLEIVDLDGRVLGPLTGLVVFPGESIKDALMNALPPGCGVRLKQEPPQ